VILFWVLLLIAVIGVIGVVASGYGGGLTPVGPDRPALGLPPEPLSAEDLDGLRFSSAVRGYRMDEVDAVLDRVRDELAARDAVIADLRAGAGGSGAPASGAQLTGAHAMVTTEEPEAGPWPS
jgi:DivIVA domain-containing protein